MTNIWFFTGKGGSGKTTCGASFAVKFADEGHKVLVSSIDPAHNLGDVFQTRLSSSPRKITDNLHAIEVNMEKTIRKYLKDTANSLKSMYRYLTTFNLEGYLDTIRLSPGIEEYATLEAIKDILASRRNYDDIIFDTAPTGLTLRVLALPTVSLVWVDKLIELRNKILDKRFAIEKIQGEKTFVISGEKMKLKTRPNEDNVLRELIKYRAEIGEVKALLLDDNITNLVVVMNPDELSLYETERAVKVINKLEIPLKMLIINKVIYDEKIDRWKARLDLQENVITKVKEEFRGIVLREVPMENVEPKGIEMLRNFSKNISLNKW
jgi:arsenite-transporting ATPase